MPQYVRLPSVNKPVNVKLYNRADNSLLQEYNTSDDEITIPDTGGFYLKGTDSQGKTSTVVIDNISRILLKKRLVGKSVPNGNTANHLDWITKSVAKGLDYLATVWNDIETDAQLIALENSVFNHTVAPPGGVYQFPYDEVVRQAWLTSPGSSEIDLINRVTLKVGILLTRDNNKLNNGSTRTLFYTLQDSQMRQDGNTPVFQPRSPVPQGIVPSYASPAVETFTDRLVQAFYKHYLPAFNDGTIMGTCLITGNSGECEYPHETKDSNGNTDGEFHGDFNIAMINKFRAYFPQYSNLANSTIHNNDRTGTELSQKWGWALADVMHKFEKKRVNNIKTNVPGLIRTKFHMTDCGSYVDPLAPRRRTFNCFARLLPETLIVKFNDESNQSEDTMRYTIGHGAALGRKVGARAIYEPSPQNGDYSDPGNRGSIQFQVNNIMMEETVGFSFYDESTTNMDWFLANTELLDSQYVQYKDEFKTVSGNKKLIRSSVNISQILAVNSRMPSQTAYLALRSSESKTYIDIDIVDDIAASAVQPSTTTTTTSSTSTTTSGSPTTTTSTSTTTNNTPVTLEAGEMHVVQGGKTYSFVNSRNMILSVTNDNKIKLDYPEFLQSSDGSKTCKGWLMNGMWAQIPDDEKNALRNPSGLALEDGDYHFVVYWAATSVANTFMDLRTQVWALFGNPATRVSNSREMEYIILSIRTNPGV